jgi:hypothetical protein
MFKTFIAFRAKFILPFRWAYKKNKKALIKKMPTTFLVLEKLEEENLALTSLDPQKDISGVSYRKGVIDTLTWLLAHRETTE